MICLRVLYSKCVGVRSKTLIIYRARALNKRAFLCINLCAFLLGWWGCFFGVWATAYVYVFEAQLPEEEDAHLRTRAGRQHERTTWEQVAISEIHHTNSYSLFPMPYVAHTDTPGLRTFHPLCASLLCPKLRLWAACLPSLTQGWLKRGNRIRRITTLKIIKSTFREKKKKRERPQHLSRNRRSQERGD